MWLIKFVWKKQISFGYLSPLKTAIEPAWNDDIVRRKKMDALTHLKPGKCKLITEAGPTALFFILLLINLSVSLSCLLATDNKEAKHFSLCFMSLSCTQSRCRSSDVILFSPPKKDRLWCRIVMSWIHLINKDLANGLSLRVEAKHKKLLFLTFV